MRFTRHPRLMRLVAMSMVLGCLSGTALSAQVAGSRSAPAGKAPAHAAPQISANTGANTPQKAPPKAPSKASTAAERARAAARRATVAAGAAGAAAATAVALAAADEDQRHAYTLTHLGEYECEFKRAVRVLAHPGHEGYVDMHFDKRVITARPVLSSTGAIRLEDIRGRYLMVQIAFKSMLLDTRSGQRVADECLHDNHHAARREAAGAPAQPGLGISQAPPPSNAAPPPAGAASALQPPATPAVPAVPAGTTEAAHAPTTAR